uniref:Uncharacterized protein n=1 Tax=Rhizophora mucronata TaxID=61149 RepID=A0A2P2QSJ6_RHIMU
MLEVFSPEDLPRVEMPKRLMKC